MVKIIALCPNVNDATSFYRGAWPLSRMVQWHRGFCSVHFQKTGGSESMGWGDLSQYDLLFIQRPYTHWNLELMHLAKEIGMKVWIDYDDDLLNIEHHNPAFKTYSDPKVKDTITKIIKTSDLITFSTEHLKSIMSFDHPNAHVVKNATDFDLLEINKSTDAPKLENTIFWRGSRTHDNDLFQYAEAMGKIAKNNPKWRFIFLGNPWFGLSNFIPSTQSISLPSIGLPKYFSFIQTLKPAISIVPLSPSIFNMSKSNIAWQEATIAGSPCLVPDWPEWSVAGPTVYKNSETFYDQLQDLISYEGTRKINLELSCVTMRKDFDLRSKIKERIRLVEKLCSM